MKTILVYCRGDQHDGFGHLVRELYLAEALFARGVHVEFVTHANTPGVERIQKAGYPVNAISPDAISDFIAADKSDGVIIDVRYSAGLHGPERKLLEIARGHKLLVAIGGVGLEAVDSESLSELVDLRVHPGELLDRFEKGICGPEYVIMNPGYTKLSRNLDGHILVCMGGSDWYNLTEVSLKALADIGREVVAVIGPARGLPVDVPANARIISAPDSLLGCLDGAALSITQTGMSTFESMAAGVPCLVTNPSDEHLRDAVEIERLGCAINLGMWNEFNPSSVRERVEWILAQPEELRRMGEAGRRLVDGKGASRCADKIMEFLK